jgi:DNA polymerase IV
MLYRGNAMVGNADALVMYVDMNSYFASCEQQQRPELRGRPVGVITYDSPNAAVIAASQEAKRCGVKTGMRLNECRLLCPDIIAVTTRPAWYRQIHVDIMNILRSYCDDVLPRSIDEAVVNFTTYRWVYKDLTQVAKLIKADIKAKYDYLTCSIGIAPNTFLAKLATELQKPDGLVEITPENIDGQLAKLQLTDLPGIAARNERRLQLIGIKTPLEMRHASAALLRKAFGGIVGDYWHRRLHFLETDLYSNPARTMSAMRTASRQQSQNPQTLDALLIALCTKLEQRMVKSSIFCKELSFYIRYHGGANWDMKTKLPDPVQDGMELRSYILERMGAAAKEQRVPTLLNNTVQQIGVVVQSFVSDKVLQYSLFDNRIKHDVLRKAMYNIKDKYGKNIVRKGSEVTQPHVMRDAIGFGSIKDMGMNNDGDILNKYVLEEEDW